MGDTNSQDVVTVAIIAGILVAGVINPAFAVQSYWAAGFMAASFAAGKLLAPNVPSIVSNAKGREINVRSAIDTRKLIYGTASIGGTVVYATSSGNKHQMLHQVIVLADQESEDIVQVLFNEEDADSETFHKLWFKEARVWFDPNKLRSNGDNPNLNTFGEQNRGIFVDYKGGNSGSPDNPTHGYYYGTRSLDTDVRDNFIQVGKTTNLPFVWGEVDGFPDLYASWRKLTKHYGTVDQPADPDLIRDDPTKVWDETCTLNGITYIVVSNLFDPDKYPSGVPNITSVVKGKKVYDPREDPTMQGGNPLGTQSFDTPSTWTWSDNWALCIIDYLKDKTYGMDLSMDDIDWNSVVTAANTCDEDVPISESETRKKYSMNGIVDTGSPVAENLETMLTAAEGHIAFTQGKYRLSVAEYTVPSGDLLNEKDLSGEIQIRASVPRSELFNVVAGIFIDKEQQYIATDFPRYPPLDERNIYEEEDGEEIKRDIELPFTTDIYQAQMIAKLVLETSRQNIIVTFAANIKALQYSLWQVVLVDVKSLGWGPIESDVDNPSKEFRIVNIDISIVGQVSLTLREESEEMYDWNLGDVTLRDTAPNSGLPSPLFTIPPVISYIDTSEIFKGIDGSIQASLKIGWEDESPYTSYYEVEFKKALTLNDDIPWVGWGTTTKPLVSISPVNTGDYYFVKVKSVSNIGVSSDWTYTESILIEGELAPPSSVQSFRVSVQSDGTRDYTWIHTSREIDVEGYIIKYILQNDLPVDYDMKTIWNDGSMTNLHLGLITQSPFEYNRPTAGDYLFAIVARDASEIESELPIRYLISLPDPRTKNSIYSSDEALRDTGFPGEKISCNTHDRELYPDTVAAPWFNTWVDGTLWHSGSVASTFQYWTGNSDLTLTANSKLLAIDLGTTITFTPHMTIVGQGLSTTPTINWYGLSEDSGAVWEAYSGSDANSNIRARWLKAYIAFATLDGKIAKVDEISIELTGDLVQETLENIDMDALRTSGNFTHLFPDSTPGHMILPYTRPFEAITHISISAIGAGAATSYDIINKNLADHATDPGPEVQLYKWVVNDFDPIDLVFDAYIRGI